MTYLGDFIGQIFAEVSLARAQADLESLRLADLYANHDYLKYFPVPRVRVKDVELDMQVVILDVEDPPKGGPRGSVSSEKLLGIFINLTEDQLKKSPIKLDAPKLKRLMRHINSDVPGLRRPEYVNIDSNLAADRLTNIVRKQLEQEGIDEDILDNFVRILRAEARYEFIKARSSHPRIVVGSTSSQVREADPGSVTRISIHIIEESMEWVNILSDTDVDDRRLVPE